MNNANGILLSDQCRKQNFDQYLYTNAQELENYVHIFVVFMFENLMIYKFVSVTKQLV